MNKLFGTFLWLVFLFNSVNAFAWGERGHHLICEVATRLVKESNLKKFLETRGDTMGHICNVPDIFWRQLGPTTKPGDQAHFMNPENAGVSIDKVPMAIVDYFNLRKTEETPQQKADALGTSWWRTEQIFNLAVDAGKLAKSSPMPDFTNQQNSSFAYNRGVFSFLSNLGLMGHFVGDASMPYHNSSDYDGWSSGHGGIHGFYETNCVSSFDLNLIGEVKTQADQVQLENGKCSENAVTSALEIVRKVSVSSAIEKSEVENLDKVIEPSLIKTDERGVVFKTPAKRQVNDLACPPFRALITKQLARSAIALAAIWDQAYIAANKPDLAGYRMYLYPLTPDFTNVDYLRP